MMLATFSYYGAQREQWTNITAQSQCQRCGRLRLGLSVLRFTSSPPLQGGEKVAELVQEGSGSLARITRGFVTLRYSTL